MCQKISAWADTNEMRVGIAKCGVMVVNGSMDELGQASGIYLQGERVPVVETYTYLGLNFTPALDKRSILEPRFVQSRRTVNRLRPFLGCKVIPMYLRLKVLKAVVLPRLLYGAEVYGMCKELTNAMQTYLNKALRVLAGCTAQAPVSNVALWSEFGLDTICALAASRRARAFQKCKNLRTWVRELVVNPYRCRKWTWVTGTTRWLNRYFDRLHPDQRLTENHAWMRLSPKKLKTAIKEALAIRENRRRPCAAADNYVNRGYRSQRIVSVKMTCPTMFNPGLTFMVKARLGGTWLGKRLARHGLIHARYIQFCPCCQMRQAETVTHLLVQCRRWRTLRSVWLADLIRTAEGIVPRENLCLRARDVAILLLGGKVAGGKLPDWLVYASNNSASNSVFPMNEDSSDDDDDDYDVQDYPIPNATMSLSGGLRVAGFLTQVIRARAPIIRALRRPPGLRRVPFSASGQRPAG